MISAEEIKALVAPKLMRVAIDSDMQVINELPCEPTREQQALSTLQTLLNQAAEALEGLRGTIDKQGIGAWSSDTKQAKAAMNTLAAIEPYLTKEGDDA